MKRNNYAKRLYQWLYRANRPNWIAKILNRMWAAIHALGIAPNYLVTLEVIGRKSGRTISLPLVMAVIHGQRDLASMLRGNVQRGQNVRAAGGGAVIRGGGPGGEKKEERLR